MELSGSESPESTTPNLYYRKDNVSIHVVKQDSYNVLSVLRSYVSNISGYSATSNLVPILGADATLLKTNEQKLIKKFKKLASTLVEDDVCYLKLEHLQPFFDVFKTFDSRHVKLLIMCVEVLSNLAKSDLLCFEKNEAKELMNKLFSEVLAVFSSVIDLKEDFLLLKIFDCFEHLFRSHYGNLISNENTCNMLKLCVSLLSIRNRNSFFKKVFYTKVNDVLLSTLGNREKYGGNDKELYRRVSSVYLLLSLLSGLSNRTNNLGYYTEDSYLSVSDKDTMLSFRAHLSPVLNSLFNVPTSFNEFSDDVKKMSLILFNTSIECNLVDLTNLNLVPILQAHFTHSMYKLLFTDSITMYSLVLRSFWNLYLHFRVHLKAQVELFLNHLISSVSSYTTTSKRTRLDMLEMNMEFLSEMSKNSDFLLEMFLNFDCDVKCSNLFSMFVKCLLNCISMNSEAEASASKLEQSKTKKNLPKSAVKKTSPQYKSNTSTSENDSQLSLDKFALDTLQNIVKFLLTDYTLYTNDTSSNNNNTNNNKDGSSGSSKEEEVNNTPKLTWKMNKLVEKKYKDRISKCSKLFNEGKGDEWMNEVRKLGVFSKHFTEKEVALFLKYAPNLDLKKVGEYLATHKNPEFMDKVRSYFVQLNHFAGVPVVMAIRIFLSSFMIPGESQQIERLLEIFSKVYFATQPLVDPRQLNLGTDLDSNTTTSSNVSNKDSNRGRKGKEKTNQQEDKDNKNEEGKKVEQDKDAKEGKEESDKDSKDDKNKGKNTKENKDKSKEKENDKNNKNNTTSNTKEENEDKEIPEELKMARWVVQEDFYHKHKTLHQWKFLPSYLNSLGLNNYDNVDPSYLKDEDSNTDYNERLRDRDEFNTQRSENFYFSRDAKSWETNMNMYKYYLLNDAEGDICKQNYKKICEYLEKTPVTLETQSTYNESIPTNHNNNVYNNNTDTDRSVQSTDVNNTNSNNSSRKDNNRDNKEYNENNTMNTRSSTSSSITSNSNVNTPRRRVTVEYKPGFVYVEHYDAIFVLCYSIIMLNTDQHNQQIKNKMKVEDFVRNNRSTNHGKNFSSEFLHDIYRTIKYHEIKLHSGNVFNNTNYYDPYLWSDYVLQRQKQLSPYIQLFRLSDEEIDTELRKQRAAARLVLGTTKDKEKENKDRNNKRNNNRDNKNKNKENEGLSSRDVSEEEYDSDDLKMELFDVLLRNNLLNVLDQMFLWCRNVDLLKEIVQLFWLLVRVGLKYSDYELINRMFQLPSVDVSYALGYKCQVSISFILNVLAVSSDFFDRKSWAKSLDIVTRFYCLNLLPPTFAALDGDQRLFSNQPSDLLVPSIRFKRLTDKKSSSWLVGLSYFVPFGKGTSNPEVLKNVNKETTEGECEETFLFLFDVQLSTDDLVENKFFDVYLLRNKFSPVYSIEDESTINNVTNKLSDEDERQELLPPILTYINLRLAFLNIYKLDGLFMGVVISGNLDSFQLFLSVMLDKIFEVSSSDQDNNSNSTRDSSRERDNFGDILDPNYVELDRFRDKITSIFNLGIFSRLVLQMLVTPNRQQDEQVVKSNRFNKNKSKGENRDKEKLNKEELEKGKKGREKYKIYVDDECDSEEKKVMLLTCFVETFYNLCRSLVFKESLKYLPPTEDLYKFFDLKKLDKEYFFHFLEDNLKEELDDNLSNYVAFILLNMVFWFVDYYNNNKDVETPTNALEAQKVYSSKVQTEGSTSKLEQQQKQNNSLGDSTLITTRLGAGFRADYGLINLSSWLLHLFINFDNKLFNHYLDPLEKLLYNLAHSACISHNNYLVVVMLCAIQRMVNPYLPFGLEPFKKGSSKTNSSILTVLLRRSKCLTWNNPYVAKLTAQTLLSIALYSNTNNNLNDKTNMSNTSTTSTTKGSSSKEKSDKDSKDDKNKGNTKDKEKENKDMNEQKETQYIENQLAIQLLIEFNSFAKDDNQDNLEHLWLLSLHSLSVVFAIGPSAVSNEAMKGLNKLLLQQPYPKSNCTFTSQVARIFDYVLSPMLILNFYYPLPNNIQTPLNKATNNDTYSTNNYNLCNPFQNKTDCSDANDLWMSGFMNEYLNNFAFKDFDDLASRKASATNLICHAVLSKLTALIDEQQQEVPDNLLKSSASNLECLLCDNKDLCEENCVKRLVILTQYVLNVIIPSNGEIHTGISRDTYLETLKNFILVLLTSPELKTAPESCINHFKNDSELKVCLESLNDNVSFDNVASGEYVLSSLLAHTFSSSDSLKNLFLEVLKVVFPKIEEEESSIPSPPPEPSEPEEPSPS